MLLLKPLNALTSLLFVNLSTGSKQMNVKVKAENPRQELVLELPYMASPAIWDQWDHSITSHPTQVNAPRLNLSQ